MSTYTILTQDKDTTDLCEEYGIDPDANNAGNLLEIAIQNKVKPTDFTIITSWIGVAAVVIVILILIF